MELLFRGALTSGISTGHGVKFCCDLGAVSVQCTFVMALKKDQEINFVGGQEVQGSCIQTKF